MAKPKKPADDKPVSQHEPTPEELDEAVKIDELSARDLLKGLLGRGASAE